MDKLIQLYIDEFCKDISKTYKIPKKELKKLLSIKKKKMVSKSVSTDPHKKLQSLSKTELIKLCQEKNINAYGTKFDMVKRIISSEKEGIIQEIKHHIPMIYIRKDEMGNYVHDDTRLVFDSKDKRVIAKKSSDGKILPLSYNDIQLCLKYKFKYILPDNLMDNLNTNESKESIDQSLKKRLEEIEKEIDIDEDEDDDEEDEED
jgi:hypothetical protein